MSDCCSVKSKKHPDHSGDIPRLNRIGGQVDGINKMIEDNRYCPDILTQLKAIRSAVKSVEANILERHLHACLSIAIQSGNEAEKSLKIEEIKDLFKRYED